MNPDSAIRYMEGWKEFDPLLPAAFHTSGPPGTISLCHEFLSEEFVSGNPYFQEFLIPSGGRYQAGVILENDANHVTVLDVHSREAPLERKQLARWSPVIGHFRRSVRLSALLAEQLAQGMLLRKAIDHHGTACVMVDEHTRILDQSSAGEKLLARGEVLRTNIAGHLQLVDQTHTERLEILVASACRGQGGGTIPLGSAALGAATVQVVPAGATCDNPFSPLHANCALVFVEQPLTHRAPAATRIRAALGCTLTEADVAVALATGTSPQQIATERQTSIYTVRAKIRALLGATASNRIAELVAKIMSL